MMSMLYPLVLSVMVLLSAACGQNDEIVLGFSGPLTGAYSDIGVQGRNGATLAVEELNASGGVAGARLRLVAADDGATPESAIAADRSLLEGGAVAVIGHMTSSQTMAALGFMESQGALLISPTTATPALTGKRDNFFRLIPDNASWGTGLAEYAIGDMKARKIYILGDSDNAAYVNTFLAAFEKAFTAGGGKVEGRHMFSSRSKPDWASLAAEVNGSGAKAVVLAASARDVAAFARAASSLGDRPAILCPTWPYTREILHAGGESVEGIVFSTSFTEENLSPAYLRFRERYQNRFGWPPNFAAAYSYEAVQLVAAALRKTGGKRKGLEDALISTGPQHGVIGDFSLDASGDVNRRNFIVTISDGRFRTVESKSE